MVQKIKEIFLFRFSTKLSIDELKERFSLEWQVQKEKEGMTHLKYRKGWVLSASLKKGGNAKIMTSRHHARYDYYLDFAQDGSNTIINIRHNPFFSMFDLKAFYVVIVGLGIFALVQGYFGQTLVGLIVASAVVLPICIHVGHTAKKIIVDYIIRFLEAEPLHS